MVRKLLPVLLLLAPALRSQTPPIIRTETREVVVDVAVTDKKGVSPRELTANDFSIFEDGKQQKINSVSHAGADSGLNAGSDLDNSIKHFVLYFDFQAMSLPNQIASRKVATDFVEQFSRADRFMAVTGPGVFQNYTTAKSVLERAIASVGAQARGTAGPNRGGGGIELTTLAHSLSQSPDRKAIVMFTGGLTNGQGSVWREGMTAVMNRANIAVYVISRNHFSGLGVNAANSAPDKKGAALGGAVTAAGLLQQISAAPAEATSADFLADGTGGLSLELTDSVPELAAIAREPDEYYRVAYTPPPAKEGSCHSLRIAVSNRSLITRSRGEYCTEKSIDLVASKIAGEGLESRTASGTMNATMRLPYFYTATNRASVYLAIDITPTAMKFEKSKAGFHGQIDLVGTTTRPDGSVAERFADTVDIDKDTQEQADAFTHSPWHYEHQFALAPGTYSFQLAIGAGPSAVSKVEMPLTIEPWNSATFGMGSVALSAETRPVGDSQDLEEQSPLTAGGKQFVPTASGTFRTSGRLYFYTEIYEPTLSGENPAKVTAEVRITDRKSGDLKIDSGMVSIAGYLQAGNPIIPFASLVPTAQLPTGSYRLEVRSAHSSGSEVASRTVDFELN